MNKSPSQLLYDEYFDEEIYRQFHFLLWHAITTFRYLDQWEEEIMPYLESLASKTGKIDDWNSFDWGGTICFRYNHVLILDESLFQVGSLYPPIRDENNNPLVNDYGESLYDTIFLKEHYEEFVYIPLEEFIKICKIWMERGAR
jgi:hypothetical protein